MEIIFTKGTDRDFIKAARDDGSVIETTFPKKGWYPHDAVHVVVEKHLGLSNGFWGIVSSGASPEEVGEMAKEAGHASAKRADVPDEIIRELIIAERAVECFEAEMWGEPADFNTFRSVLKAACKASFVEMPEIDNETIAAIRNELNISGQHWKALENGMSISMTHEE